MTRSYTCPKCGARDSTKCDFRISQFGTVVPSQMEAARKAGCRVMHYTDQSLMLDDEAQASSYGTED